MNPSGKRSAFGFGLHRPDKAAAEMEERVDALVPYGYADVWISTFHAFGDRLRHVHLCDGSAAASEDRVFDEHLLPGEGGQPVAEVLRLLAERDLGESREALAERTTHAHSIAGRQQRSTAGGAGTAP